MRLLDLEVYSFLNNWLLTSSINFQAGIKVLKPRNISIPKIKRSSFFVWKMFHQTGRYALKISQKTMMRKNRRIVDSRRSLRLLQAYSLFRRHEHFTNTCMYFPVTPWRGIRVTFFSLFHFFFISNDFAVVEGQQASDESRLIKSAKTILSRRAEYRSINQLFHRKFSEHKWILQGTWMVKFRKKIR